MVWPARRYDEFGRLKKEFRAQDKGTREVAALERLHGAYGSAAR